MRVARFLGIGAVTLLLTGWGLSPIWADDERPPLTSEVSSEVSVITVDDTLNKDAFNPAVDVWKVKCKGKTEICAEVHALGPNFDNTFHVTTACVRPPTGEPAEGEFLDSDTDGDEISDGACVFSCTEAVVTVRCDLHDFCDDTYHLHIECVGKGFAAKTPKQTQDQD